MPGYDTVILDVPVGTHTFRLKSLLDRQQYADPRGEAAGAGICSSSWPYFGWLWPAAVVLAEAMTEIDISGRRILEIGCGLGLPSLVLKRNGADITASDHHPLVEPFLDFNAALNEMPPVDFVDLRWDEPMHALGRFDVIIGSDVLYERGHAELLARLIERHSKPHAEVWMSCPGRGYLGRFNRALRAQGFEVTAEAHSATQADFRSRLLRYRRYPLRCATTLTSRGITPASGRNAPASGGTVLDTAA